MVTRRATGMETCLFSSVLVVGTRGLSIFCADEACCPVLTMGLIQFKLKVYPNVFVESLV